MAEERVQVRIVPKDAAGRAESWDFHVPPGYGRNRFLPDPARAVVALSQMIGLGLPSLLTRSHTLKAAADISMVENTFKTRLVRDNRGRFRPTSELIVPQCLKDTVAFAYIPTPFEYYGPTLAPPKTDAYHLTLDDVARVLGATDCHNRGIKGDGITVAVVDSGLGEHPYFEERGYKLMPMKDGPGGDASEDWDGHGTGVAANVFAVAPESTVMGVTGWAAESLEYCVAKKADVINCSWGWDIDYVDLMTFYEEEPNVYWELVEIESIVQRANEAGVTVLFSSGNGQKAAPGCLPQVLAVGGVTVTREQDVRASNAASAFESSFYPGRNVPDLCGIMGELTDDGGQEGHIMLPVPEDSDCDGGNLPEMSGWGLFSGTSAAAPQVAGVVALMLSVNPDLKPERVREILVQTSRDVIGGVSAMKHEAVVGPDLATGAGLVNAVDSCAESALDRSTKMG